MHVNELLNGINGQSITYNACYKYLLTQKHSSRPMLHSGLFAE